MEIKAKLALLPILMLLTLSPTIRQAHSESELDRLASPTINWQIETVTEEVATYDWTASLALDNSGDPHVSYQDPSNAPDHRLEYAHRSGSAWVEEVVDHGLYVGWPSSIALDAGGAIHIGYGAEDVVFYTRRVTTTWQTSLVDVGYKQKFNNISLALDNGDSPHLSYYNWDSKEILYAFFDANLEKWQQEVVDTNASFAAALAWNAGPHILYKDNEGIQYAHSGGSGWTIQTIAKDGDISHHALALKPDGTPCVVISEIDGLYYACGGGWEKQRISSSQSGASLGIDENGKPHVVYSSGGLQYATLEGTTWAGQVVDSWGSYISNLAFNGPNEIGFLYGKNGDLMYARGTGLVTTDLIADKIEVTQAVQDLKNSVRLVEGKQTFVRFHVHSAKNTHRTTAQLLVSGSTGTTTLSPINSGGYINVRPSPDRSVRDHAFLFKLPKEFTQGTISLKAELNPYLSSTGRSPLEKDYANNTVSTSVNFETVPTVPLVVYEVSYSVGGTRHRSTDFGSLVTWLRRAYPLSDLRTWRRTYNHGTGRPTCTQVNSSLSYKRWWDKLNLWGNVPGNVRYYGMVSDGGGFMRGCSTGAPGFTASGPTGDPRRSFPWDTDGSYGDWYGGHELGHAFGRDHTLCQGEPPPYESYPFPGGRISGQTTGEDAFFGFDVSTRQIYGPNWVDNMSYCSNQWISEYTTEALMDYFKDEYAMSNLVALGGGVKVDRVLFSGSIIPGSGQAELLPLFVVQDAEDLIPRTPGDFAIVLRGASGNQLARYPFTPTESHEEGGESILFFTELVPFVVGTTQVDIEGSSGVLYTVQAGANPPSVTLTKPNGGETLTGDTVTVSWNADDPDGDPLTFNLQYSPDNGLSWEMVSLNITGLSVDLETINLVAGQQALFGVWVSDGIHTASDQSDAPFTVPNRDPQVDIVSPDQGVTIAVSQTLSLEATVYDPDIGSMDGDQVQWSSDLDGSLGTGSQLSVSGLGVGMHTITVQADDGEGGVFTDEVQVTVVADLSELPALPDWLIAGPSLVTFMPGEVLTQTRMSVDNQNLAHSIAWNASTSQPWVQLSNDSGETPFDDLYASFQDTGLDYGIYTATITITSPDVPEQDLEIDIFVELTGHSLFIPLLVR